MKKILSAILCFALLISALALVGCGEKSLKLGLGVVISGADANDATEDTDAIATVDVTAAAVLVDNDGKIVKCVIDTITNEASYTALGTANAAGEFKTKYEQGDAYGMVAYGGATLEWFEQVDAFCSVVAGKTVDEVKGLVVNGYYGNEDVKAAGCTIGVADFVKAVEKAVANAADSNATESCKLGLGMVTDQTNTNSVDGKPGSIELDTTIFVTATDKDNKIVAAESDVAVVEFGFTDMGETTFDSTKEIKTKREQGDDYGMVEYAGSELEWYAQADAFEAQCFGKTASELNSLMASDYKGNEDVKAAGCTIYVSAFISAAVKAAG